MILVDISTEPRPALYVKVQDIRQVELARYYCTVHASAYRGNDENDTIARLELLFDERKNRSGNDFSWMIMRDFNKTHTQLKLLLARPIPNFHRQIANNGQGPQKSMGTHIFNTSNFSINI